MKGDFSIKRLKESNEKLKNQVNELAEQGEIIEALTIQHSFIEFLLRFVIIEHCAYSRLDEKTEQDEVIIQTKNLLERTYFSQLILIATITGSISMEVRKRIKEYADVRDGIVHNAFFLRVEEGKDIKFDKKKISNLTDEGGQITDYLIGQIETNFSKRIKRLGGK